MRFDFCRPRCLAVWQAIGIVLVPLALSGFVRQCAAQEPAAKQGDGELADEIPPDAWPPALDQKRMVGMWLLANGGNERYLMIWLKEDGTFVRGVVHNPWGKSEKIRLEGDAIQESPWKIRRVPHGGYELRMGEPVKQPDGSTVSTAQALSLTYVDRTSLTLGGGFAGALVDLGSVYKRASPDAVRAIAQLIGK